MEYDFKLVKELFWAAAVGAAVFALTVLAEFDPDVITSWQVWAISVGSGCVRAAAGAVLAKVR